jgi:hypothetical protein
LDRGIARGGLVKDIVGAGTVWRSHVMVQREQEFASVGVSGKTPNGGPFHEQ